MLPKVTTARFIFILGCVMLGAGVPARAQGVVELISPPDGAVFPVPAVQITFQWQAYSGAAAYAYWLEDSMGHTLGQDPNPHKVGNTTEVALWWPATPERWKWFVMAYSDTGYANEIARSATWTFEVSETTPTPTPTPTGPTPTPVLPAPIPTAPPHNSQMTVAQYNTTPGLFSWGSVDGASSYEVELVGPPDHGRRSIFTSEPTITWTEKPPTGYQVSPPYPVSGPLTWRVRGRTAAGVPGAWSEQWALYLYYQLVSNPGDINEDDRIDFKDSFEFARSWQTAEGEENYNQKADIWPDGVVEHKDLLEYLLNYLAKRRFQ